jgi:hypothetical protein
LIEFARHRDDAIVAETAPARRSQPGVVEGKSCNEGLSKAGRGITPLRLRNVHDEKSFVRQRLRGRSRMPQSREGERSGADFEGEVGGTAQSFRDQD